MNFLPKLDLKPERFLATREATGLFLLGKHHSPAVHRPAMYIGRLPVALFAQQIEFC
jgi:hypothetical protein